MKRTGGFLSCALTSLVLSSPRSLERGEDATFPELGLTLRLPALEGMRESGADGELRGSWRGTLGGQSVEIGLTVFPFEEFTFREPGDVTELVVDLLREESSFQVLDARVRQGSFGYAPFVSIIEAELPGSSGDDGTQFLLGGLLQDAGYLVHVECRPTPDEAARAELELFLHEGIAYQGSSRDPRWTDEEVLERWRRDAPEDTHEDFVQAVSKSKTKQDAIIRTEHYLIMTNSSSGKLFAKKMEENYDRIRKVFPFEDVPGQRLMPVFLFRTPEQYHAYYVKIAKASLDEAEKSAGHAWKDYYATWYEAPGDPVHIHEMTHQIFSNRLRLSGAGSWFQEGVAEYMETAANERNEIGRIVKDGEHTPLRELVALDSLLGSSESDVRGRGGAGEHYKQAALLIEFLCESKFGKAKFAQFLRTMGKVPDNDVEAIDAAFQVIYGQGIDGIETEWRSYCAKR